MAFQACDCHGTKFRGKSSYAYPCMLHDGVANRRRVRLCPAGVDYLEAGLQFEFMDLDGPEAAKGLRPSCCIVCRQPVDQDDARLVFVTAYLRGEDRRDYSGLACGAHEADAARMLFLGT